MSDTRCLNTRGCPNVGISRYVSRPGSPLQYYPTRACTDCWRGYLIPGPPYPRFAEAPARILSAPFPTLAEASIQPT